MKELTIEEKASRYDDAIKRIEDIKTGKCETTFMFTEGLFEHIFPELAELEDERIRKNIKIALMSMEDNLADFYSTHRTSQKELLAWLEKQGEIKEINYDEELKKCKANPLYFFDKYVKVKLKEQKPAWSEEDETRFESCIKVLQTSDGYDTINAKWLKSIKERNALKQVMSRWVL